MKLLHISQELYTKPLLITKPGFLVVHNLLQSKIRGEKDKSFIRRLMPKLNDDYEDMLDEDSGYTMEIDNGVAYIPIFGVIGKRLSMIEKCCGATDIQDLQEQIDMAVTNDNVQMICFVCDSPGGSASGVPELSEYISMVNSTQKKCIAYIEGMCCSACYFLISGVDEIYASVSSYVGSVGVYTYLLDESVAYANEGVKPIVIRSGDEKGDLLPGLPIEDSTIKKLQSEVNYINTLFQNHVNRHRFIDSEYLQGGAYYAEESLKYNFIDSIVNNINDIFVKSD